MGSSSKSNLGRSVILWGGIGILIAIIMAVLNLVGINIPVVLGTTEYTGWQSVGILAISSVILFIVIGFIAAAFKKSE